MLIERLNLIGRHCGGQCLIGGIELLVQLVHFGSERHQFIFRALIFSKRSNRLSDFIGIHLGREICMDHHGLSLKSCADLLIQHHHDSGSIGPDLIPCDVQIFDFGYALEVGRNLLQRLSLCRFNGQSDGVGSGVVIAHSVLAARGDDSDGRRRRTRHCSLNG